VKIRTLAPCGKASQFLGHGASAFGWSKLTSTSSMISGSDTLRRANSDAQPEAKTQVELLRRAPAQLLRPLVLCIPIQNNQALAILLLENPLIRSGSYYRAKALEASSSTAGWRVRVKSCRVRATNSFG